MASEQPLISNAPDGESFAIPGDAELRRRFAEIVQRASAWREAGGRVVAVQGLGFVGAAVAAVLADARDDAGKPLFLVIGVDLPTPQGYWKVARLDQGRFPLTSPDPSLPVMTARAAGPQGNLAATPLPDAYGLADVIVVDIPLDVADRSQAQAGRIEMAMGGFEKGLAQVGAHMRPEALVLIETTVPMGTCRGIARPILEEQRRQRGIDAPPRLAHAYERVMPGSRYAESIRRFWRSFSADDPESADLAREFLESFIDTSGHPLCQLPRSEASEMAKLLENSYRAMNIAFIHEWTLLAERSGVNLFEVVDSIRVRSGTHDNIRFPGFGVGGYCLTKDSLLAQWSSDRFYGGGELSLTLQALRVNYQMPLHTLDLAEELLGGSLAGREVALCGISYLPELADTRNSPSEIFYRALLERGGRPRLHDPFVREWPEVPEARVSGDLTAALKGADAVVLAVPHRAYLDLSPKEFSRAVGGPTCMVDAMNIFDDPKARALHQAGCRLLGVGKGHWRAEGLMEQP